MKKMFLLPVIALLVTQVSCNKKSDNVLETKIDSTSVSQSSSVSTSEFNKELKFNNFSFAISAKDGVLSITPSGLAIDNAPLTKNFTGTITNAEIGDINGDNAPEVFVYFSEGDDKKGSLVGYSSNAGKSMSEVSFPEMDDKSKDGYKGQDEFAMVENSFVQRFPLFDAQGNKTGKTRQIQYKLKDGEAMRALVVDKVVEY